MENLKPMFNKGDKVRVIAEGKRFEVREVVKWTYDSDRGFTYQISAKEVDMSKKIVVDGIQSVTEKEIALIEQ